jgi:hypothetical protein
MANPDAKLRWLNVIEPPCDRRLPFSCAEIQKPATSDDQEDARRQRNSYNSPRFGDYLLIAIISFLAMGRHHDIASHNRGDSDQHQDYASNRERLNLH